MINPLIPVKAIKAPLMKPQTTPMRIAYVAPGAAGMYCGSCIHDNTLARALIDLGHDAAIIGEVGAPSGQPLVIR